jgi:hypothetical protein
LKKRWKKRRDIYTKKKDPGANPTIPSYNASAVTRNNA